MVNPSCSLSREVQRKLRVLVLGYLMEQNLSSTPVHVKALEGAIFQALFDSLFRQLASRKGNVNVFARKYEEWLRCSLELAERLSSVGKSANALAVLVAGAQRLDLRDLRAGRHKKGLPYEIELLFQLDQVRRQLKRGPRRTSENLRQRVDFLSNALRSDPIRTILYGTSIPD